MQKAVRQRLCEAKCAVCPLATIAYHCGGTLWRFIAEDPRLVMIPSSDTVSAECLSASEVALWIVIAEKGMDAQASMLTGKTFRPMGNHCYRP